MTHPPGVPGIGSAKTAQRRAALLSDLGALLLPGGRTIKGSAARDPGNTGYIHTLRAGMLMGKRTADAKYAPSVIGSLGVAYAGTATQMNLEIAAEAAEITRRIGATGTFKITGPQVTGGQVRTRTVTYSAVGAGAGVNEVQTFTPDAAASAGTYRIKLQKPDGTYVWTATIAWNATLAVCQAAITLALGAVAGWVASSAGSAAPWSAGPIALVLTASGAGYTAYNYPMCEIDIDSLTGVATMTEVQTTRGVPVAATLTVTALGLAARNEVQTLTFNAAMTAGTVTFGIMNIATGVVEDIIATWTTDWAGTMAAWNALVVARFGSAVVVITGTATVPVFTFSGGAYAGRTHPLVTVDITGVTGPASITSLVRDPVGASEGFTVGSLIQPTDGSEIPLGLLADGYGIKCTDADEVSMDAEMPELLTAGVVDASQILNYGTEAAVKAQIKTWLRAIGSGWVFDDDF